MYIVALRQNYFMNNKKVILARDSDTRTINSLMQRKSALTSNISWFVPSNKMLRK